MTITLSRTYQLQSAHRLTNLHPGHKCMRPHGHNYKVVVEVTRDTLKNGFILDAEDLDLVLQPLISRLDHNELNHALLDGSAFSVECASQPTAENIARYILTWLLGRLGEVRPVSVSVTENERLTATARP